MATLSVEVWRFVASSRSPALIGLMLMVDVSVGSMVMVSEMSSPNPPIDVSSFSPPKGRCNSKILLLIMNKHIVIML